MKKIILITGATGGLGLETATQLAREGHQLLIHGRNETKTNQAVETLKKITGNEAISPIIADLDSMEAIGKMCQKLNAELPHLDVLINNAGAQFKDRNQTQEGHEKNMMINLFAPFLLTYLLLPLLQKSRSGRVVTVSSASHKMGGKPNLSDIEFKEIYSFTKAYAWSKLYVIWVMRHFVKYAQQKGIQNVTFNTVHPASTKSDLGRDVSWAMKMLYFVWQLMMIPVEKAAWSSVYAATSPEVEGKNDLYIGPKGLEKSSDKYYSPENEQIIWDYCMKISEKYIKKYQINY